MSENQGNETNDPTQHAVEGNDEAQRAAENPQENVQQSNDPQQGNVADPQKVTENETVRESERVVEGGSQQEQNNVDD